MSTLRPTIRSTNSNNTANNNSVNDSQPPISNSYNVMEYLVGEEVNRQLRLLPIKTVRYIKSADVLAYALNRLPSLYATSKRGWQRHLHYAKTELKEKITLAVQQGIIAVQRDPLRVSDLIYTKEDSAIINQSANAALEKLKLILRREDLSWENLSTIVEQSLHSSSSNTSSSNTSTNARNYGRLSHSTDHWETYRF
jgi:hypothetical protein